jgi:hypothetical protein
MNAQTDSTNLGSAGAAWGWHELLIGRRREIWHKLQQLGPELGDIYAAAVRLLGDEGFPARVRLIAHAARELTDRLPLYLDVPVSTGHPDYEPHIKTIAGLWRARAADPTIAGMPNAGEIPEDGQSCRADRRGVGLSQDLYRQIDNLVEKYAATTTHRETLTRTVEALDQGAAGGGESYLEPVVGQWKRLHGWFVKATHVPGPGHAAPDPDECERRFELLEDVLYGLLFPFYAPMEELDGILAEANRPAG